MSEEITAVTLKNVVEQWVDKTFNFIQLDVYVKMCDDQLFEHIEPLDPKDYTHEYLNEIDETNAVELVDEWLEEGGDPDKHTMSAKLTMVSTYEDELIEFINNNQLEKVEEFVQENRSDSNYPMWNTLFEFKHIETVSSTWREAIVAEGLGIINSMEYFNDTIFMTSAGHSFYGSYWIPLYLRFFPSEAEKYKGIDYSMM